MVRRRREEEEHENHERWLVSYADFITLLFAFFVVMYAVSSVNEGKYKVLSSALGEVFSSERSVQSVPGVGVQPGVVVTPIDRVAVERKRTNTLVRNLMRSLAPLIREGVVRVVHSRRGVSVEMNASMLFDSGQARLSGMAMHALEQIAAVISSDKGPVDIEGHTDSLVIANSMYPSNWELSAARAASVGKALISNGVARQRITIVGRADTRPLAQELDEDSRAKNRRVVILLRTEVLE